MEVMVPPMVFITEGISRYWGRVSLGEDDHQNDENETLL
jgi:hypothetical protein